MTSNLYKVGDWVYCEISPHQPYVIRKIEELTKTPCGNVEAKVICAFRHQDIPAAIMATVEKYQQKEKQLQLQEKKEKQESGESSGSECPPKSEPAPKTTTTTNATTTTNVTTTTNATTDIQQQQQQQQTDYEESEISDLNELQRYNLKHRELYFSKYTDTIAATTIRAKCSVLLFNEEVERYADFVNKDDSFYYHLTYDPYQKSIVADKGEIRVGSRYQVEIPAMRVTPNGSLLENVDLEEQVKKEEQSRHDRVLRSQLAKMTSGNSSNKQQDQVLPEISITCQMDEQLQWCPINCHISCYKNHLTDEDIDKFLILAKSIGTYARALDCNNAFKQPSLPLSAASASRDITLFHAMTALHDHNYDLGRAALSLITQAGPVICRDELEDWSASEANIFEEALDKYGKDFNEIRKDFLPWKSLKAIIEYYYTWKTTDRYVQQKRIKMTEQESKLKQVYIPNHSKQNQSALIKASHVQFFTQYDVHLKSCCESCGLPNTSTNQWYAFAPPSLVQLIMAGNTNPNALANAAAQLIASQVNQSNGITHPIQQSRLCAECWIYWKKFSSFKFPNQRTGRLNQLKNVVHKCSVLGCGREFKMKQLLVKHCGIAHGYFAKQMQTPAGANSARPPPIRNRTAFYLYTTPMTQAARLVCSNTIRMRKLSRKPFKLIELSELNKEWSKQPRNIQVILNAGKKRTSSIAEKLSVALIDTIMKNRVRLLKRKKNSELKQKRQNGAMQTNGHAENNGKDVDEEDVDEEDEDNCELVIDNDNCNDVVKPEFLKYFEQKCKEPCYVPERLAFVKPSAEQINKYHLNLMSQQRKRSHDQLALDTSNQAAGNSNKLAEAGNNNNNGNGNGSGSAETSPMSKRSLLSNGKQASQQNTGNTKPGAAAGKQGLHQTPRQPQRSTMKPTQSINLLDAPEDIYYVCTNNLKQLRRDLTAAYVQKLARKPYKHLDAQFTNLYDVFDKIKTESLAKLKTDAAKLNGEPVKDTASSSNGDEAGKSGLNTTQVDEIINCDSVTEQEKKPEQMEQNANSDSSNSTTTTTTTNNKNANNVKETNGGGEIEEVDLENDLNENNSNDNTNKVVKRRPSQDTNGCKSPSMSIVVE